MNFQQVASSLDHFFKAHDLDPALYQVHITTFSPIALDQLRLALSSDYKHLWAYDLGPKHKSLGPLGRQPWPHNHFVGRFQISGVRFRTGLEPRTPDPFPRAIVGSE